MIRGVLSSRVAAVRAVVLAFVAPVVIIVGVAGTKPAEAAFPGKNGRLAFTSDRDGDFEVFTMRPDGSDVKQLTKNKAVDAPMDWSPDGKKLVFVSDRDGDLEVYTMNADGSGVKRLTFSPGADSAGSWSPDGKKIAFESNRDGNFEIFVMNANGLGVKQLTFNGGFFPDWSPDGTKIVFHDIRTNNSEVRTINANGSNEINLTNDPPGFGPADRAPDFSPNSRQLAFASDRDGGEDLEILVMGADGSNPTNRTNNEANDDVPVFSPDGKKIVFMSDRDGNSEVYTMNANGSGTKRLTRSPATDLAVDWQPNTAPAVTNFQPSSDSTTRDKTPTVRATVTDQQTDLANADITLSLDGKAVSRTRFSYDTSTDRLAFTPERVLSAGRHTVKVVARDDVLLASQRTWSFKVATS
jgi:Tol biopolymer transport system component